MNLKLNARDQALENTYELLRRGETEIKLLDNYKNVVLVLGGSGNAKTKFTMWIVGDDGKLISKAADKIGSKYLIEEINDSCRSIITSDTIYPQMMIDVETNTVFYDCPGFEDTREASIEIATTNFIKKVLNHAESVKLIFAINYPAVEKGIERSNFMNLMKHIGSFINDVEKFKNSIALVVTKVDNQFIKQGNNYILVDDSDIIEAVGDFLIEVKEELEEKLQNNPLEEKKTREVAIKFISILLFKDENQYPRIGIFRRPDEPGPVSEISSMQKGKKPVKKIIHENLVFTTKEDGDFGFTISEKCKNLIFHLVETINENVKGRLCRVIDEINEHFNKTVSLLRSTVQTCVEEILYNEELQEARELSAQLREGCSSIFALVEDVKSVSNPEDLAQKIKTVISHLNINASTDDMAEIEKNGKCFNFLQVVSDEQLSTIQWDKLFEVLVLYLSNASAELQKDIEVAEPKICKQIETDFQEIAKSLQYQFDKRAKTFDMNDVLVELSLYHDAMVEITEKANCPMSITEFLQIVRDVMKDIKINLSEQKAQDVMQKEMVFIFLQAISETKVDFIPPVWKLSFQNLVKHLEDSEIWYTFLNSLYDAFSKYEIQSTRDLYNVAFIEDWGKPGKPQGIVITKNNFEQFLSNLANYNNIEFDVCVKNIELTELRLDDLNEMLSITLKYRAVPQYAPPHIFIRADYISLKEIAGYSEQNSDTVRNFSAALRSGEFKSLHIYALRKVFIDGNFSFPGGELIIVSPDWEIIGIRVINLDGADGDAHSEIKAEDGVGHGSDGKNGEPGFPGKPGGNFFGIAASILNCFNLGVSVNGGNGGPGQEGGDGASGENGTSIGILTNNDLPEFDEKIKKYKIKGFACEIVKNWSGIDLIVGFLKIFNGDIGKNRLFKIPGLPGKSGGNGGNGGKGGTGGFAGSILLLNLSEESKITGIANKGTRGRDGKGGVGGNGGMNGNIKFGLLEGIISKEWQFQSEELDKTFSSNLLGKGGKSGINSSGIKYPEPANAINEPFKIIENYKIYASENLACRFKKPFIVSFIDLHNCNDKVKSICAVDINQEQLALNL